MPYPVGKGSVTSISAFTPAPPPHEKKFNYSKVFAHHKKKRWRPLDQQPKKSMWGRHVSLLLSSPPYIFDLEETFQIRIQPRMLVQLSHGARCIVPWSPAPSVRAMMAPGSERADMILKKFCLIMHLFRLFVFVVVVVLFRFVLSFSLLWNHLTSIP